MAKTCAKVQKKRAMVGSGSRFGLLSRDEYAKQKPSTGIPKFQHRNMRHEMLQGVREKLVPNKPSDIVKNREKDKERMTAYQRYLEEQGPSMRPDGRR
jgi:hypothetical protein